VATQTYDFRYESLHASQTFSSTPSKSYVDVEDFTDEYVGKT
jgi:hypothetical protein